MHDEEKDIHISEENLSDYVGKPIFTSEKMYPETPVSRNRNFKTESIVFKLLLI